jgi:hypothetical protein
MDDHLYTVQMNYDRNDGKSPQENPLQLRNLDMENVVF